MTRFANALWASAAIGLALTGTAVAQTSPTTSPTNDDTANKNDNNDNKNDPKNKKDTSTTSSDTNDTTNNTTSTPSTTDTTNTTTNTTTTPSTTNTPSTGTTGTAGANGTTGTTDVPGQAGTSGVAGGVSAEGTLNVPPPAPPPPPPPPAYQQPTTYYTSQPAATTTVIHERERGYSTPESAIGIVIAAGGGAGGFISDQLRNTTNVGGDWDVRLTFATRSPLSLEGSYIGSAQTINALGLSNNATLVGNGVQGDVRLNATFDFPVQPFIYAGAAWRHYQLTNMSGRNLSDVRGTDDVLEIPMGVGVASRFGRAILDVRGEFRASRYEDLVPQTTGANGANMDRWGAKATVGMEF